MLIEFDPLDEVEDAMLKEFVHLGFSKSEVDELYTVFVGMDRDNSHEISRDEFLRGMTVESTMFMRAVFGIMDMDGSGELNFLEFVCIIWNILCNDAHTMGSFIYLLVKKSEGEIRREMCRTDEALDTLRGIHMKEKDSGGEIAVEAILRNMTKKYGGEISPQQMESFVYENPSLCSPIFTSQDLMRKILLGKPVWARLLRRRRASPSLDNYKYPFILRDYVEKVSQRKAAQAKKNKTSKELAMKHKQGGARKNSVLLSFFNADKGKHLKKVVADAVRTQSQLMDGLDPRFAQELKGKNPKDNIKNFANAATKFIETEKKNAIAFKGYNQGNVTRPGSAKVTHNRGAPVTLGEAMGDGVGNSKRIFATNKKPPPRPKSSKR
jgi:Ca2+-binding EF-hand superfamily protein